MVQHREHLFCSCILVDEAWVWLCTSLLQLLPTTVRMVGNNTKEFVLMKFHKDIMYAEYVWLFKNYYDSVSRARSGSRGWPDWWGNSAAVCRT
jgi:uncharacterized membrane protein